MLLIHLYCFSASYPVLEKSAVEISVFSQINGTRSQLRCGAQTTNKIQTISFLSGKTQRKGMQCYLTLMRFTAHWSSTNSSKRPQVFCWENQMKAELCTLFLPETTELTLICRDRRRTPKPEEITNRTSVTVCSILLCIHQLHVHLQLRTCGSNTKLSVTLHFHWLYWPHFETTKMTWLTGWWWWKNVDSSCSPSS